MSLPLDKLPVRMVTADELSFDPDHPRVKPVPPEHLMTLVVPGRRALGETWTRVEVGAVADGIVIQREDAEAPADGQIMIVAGEEAEASSYILQALYERASERQKLLGELSYAEKFAAVNAAWFAFLEQKLRWHRGRSTLGASGRMTQRTRIEHPKDRAQREQRRRTVW